MNGIRITEQQRETVIRLAAQRTVDGRPLLDIRTICKEVGLSWPTVGKILRDEIARAYEARKQRSQESQE